MLIDRKVGVCVVLACVMVAAVCVCLQFRPYVALAPLAVPLVHQRSQLTSYDVEKLLRAHLVRVRRSHNNQEVSGEAMRSQQ